MSGTGADELLRLRSEASRFDDDALVELASKGLVRRARKLADGAAITSRADDDGVTSAGEGWTVHHPPGAPVAAGRCDCATAGACHHVVAVIITLAGDARGASLGSTPTGGARAGQHPTVRDADVPAPVLDAGSALIDLLTAVSDDDLRRWAGTPGLRWALDRSSSIEPHQVAVDVGRSVRVLLPSPLPAVRFMSGSLAAAIVEPSSRHDPRVVVLAILVLRRRAGATLPVLTPARHADLPVSRRSVVEHATGLAREAVRQGLLHLGDPHLQQLDALAASGRGAGLHRLAAVADRAGDQIEALLGRHAAADTAQLLGGLAELHTVAGVIADQIHRGEPTPDALVGTARAAYEAAGTLELVGVGRFEWGDRIFGGTTVVLCEVDRGRLFTVSVPRTVRGRGQGTSLGWEHAPALDSLVGTRLVLHDARVSAPGRLSTSAATAATTAGVWSVDDLGAAIWNGELPEPPSRLRGETGERWVVIVPDDVDDVATYDPIVQRLRWNLQAHARSVSVELGFGPQTAVAIDRLSALLDDSRRPSHVIGRLRADGALTVEPVSVVVHGELVDLGAPDPSSRLAGVTTGPNAGDLTASPGPGVLVHLERVRSELVHAVERGTERVDADAIERLARRAGDRGFGPIHSVLVDDRQPLEVRVLRAGWVLDECRVVAAGA